LVFLIYRYRFSTKARRTRARLERLSELPVHRAQLYKDYDTTHGLSQLVRAHIHTVNEFDEDGNTALKIILGRRCAGVVDSETMVLLLEAALPFDVVTGEPYPIDLDKPGWAEVVQHDDATLVEAVGTVLEKYPSNIRDLTSAVDAKGRCCLDIASPTCKTLMLRRLYLHGRYEVQQGPPEHRSSTSAVYFAKDHVEMLHDTSANDARLDGTQRGDECPLVALKFMKYRDQFEREIGIRARGVFDNGFVLDCIRSYDGDALDSTNVNFRKDAILKGYGEYPYCVVMEAGSMSLKRLIDNQNVAGKDWDAIRTCTKQIAKAVQHIHERGIAHGDLKGRENLYSYFILVC